MSLLPLMFSNWWENLGHPHYLLDQHFGVNINPETLLSPKAAQICATMTPQNFHVNPTHGYYRPWGDLLRKEKGGASTVRADKDKFHVVLDVQQFAPEEITVKVVDHFVVVEGKHEEKQDDHGWISRQFSRRYIIPEQCDIDQVSSKLSTDGVLSITVPRKQKPTVDKERVVNIECTGKPAIREKQNKKEKEEQKPE